jgi:rhodanese-related sulfurtransferase
MRELSPAEIQDELRRGTRLLDVRQPEELALASVPGAVHIPMAEIPARIGELNPAEPIAVLCHHGGRSLQVARFLERNGFADVINVAGGIDAWSVTVDTAVPRY